ncbi:MAG: hypothetical protein IT374_12810 [Polyangiaceae bacterium]|nr:hypothetical protein [Polyangiaceae bacterium]
MRRVARGAVLEAGPGTSGARRARVFEVSTPPLTDLAIVIDAERSRSACLELARAIAERLVGDALAADARALDALFDEALSALGASLHLEARLSPDDAARLCARLSALGARVLVEPGRAPGSISLASERGAVELTVADAVRRLAASAGAP